MKKIWLFFCITLLSFGAMDKNSLFEKFEKMDSMEFNRLLKKAYNCIDREDFVCAEKNWSKLRVYANNQEDMKSIERLYYSIKSAKKAKEQRLRASNSRDKRISFKYCKKGSGKGIMTCEMLVDGKYDGSIYYTAKENNIYRIFIMGSKNASINEGYYDVSMSRVWTTKCGKSQVNRTGTLSQALYKFAECSINGHY